MTNSDELEELRIMQLMLNKPYGVQTAIFKHMLSEQFDNAKIDHHLESLVARKIFIIDPADADTNTPEKINFAPEGRKSYQELIRADRTANTIADYLSQKVPGLGEQATRVMGEEIANM